MDAPPRTPWRYGSPGWVPDHTPYPLPTHSHSHSHTMAMAARSVFCSALVATHSRTINQASIAAQPAWPSLPSTTQTDRHTTVTACFCRVPCQRPPLPHPLGALMPGRYRGALMRPRGAHGSSLFTRRPHFPGRLSLCSLRLITQAVASSIGQYSSRAFRAHCRRWCRITSPS